MKDAAIMALLLAGAFLRDSPYFLAGALEAAPQGVYRIAGGLWEALLCAVIIWLLWERPRGPARTIALAAAGLVGMVNGLMNAGCRIALGPPPYPPGITECDYATGIPIDSFSKIAQGVAIIVLAGAYLGKWLGERRGP